MVFISDIAKNQSKQSVKGEILQQQSRISEGNSSVVSFQPDTNMTKLENPCVSQTEF